MKPITLTLATAALLGCAFTTLAEEPATAAHPDTKAEGWSDLIAADLSDAKFPEGVWTVADGVLTASKDKMIDVVLNGEHVTSMDMTKWTSPTKNPDGSDIPQWLSKPAAGMEPKGHIGLQGKHAGAPIFFRNLKIKSL